MPVPPNEKALRKAWLKRRFASWEYHEELLTLHDEYLTSLHRHWNRPEIQKQYPDHHRSMVTPVFFNFDQVTKPGTISRSSWNSKKTAGEANAISYNFNRGMDFANCNEYSGMADTERARLNGLVGRMLRMSENIRVTLEDGWDDSDDEILVERYTGPINWPVNWRDDIADLVSVDSTPTNVPAGQPCTREGFWFTPAQKNSRRYFQQGELMPAYPSAYGATVWQWDHHQ